MRIVNVAATATLLLVVGRAAADCGPYVPAQPAAPQQPSPQVSAVQSNPRQSQGVSDPLQQPSKQVSVVQSAGQLHGVSPTSQKLSPQVATPAVARVG